MANKRKPKQLSDRQKSILLFIEECIVNYKHPPSIREICDVCKVSSTSVADYNLKRLEAMGYIERKSHVSRGIQVLRPIGPLLESERKYQVPLYGTITAGEPIFTPDNETPPDQFIELSRDFLNPPTNRPLYALRVKGQSMIDALVDDGDIVILAHQQTANNGDMVAAEIRHSDHSEWTLKRLYQTGRMVELRPANPAMFTEEDVKNKFTFPARNVKIAGKVCLVIRQV